MDCSRISQTGYLDSTYVLGLRLQYAFILFLFPVNASGLVLGGGRSEQQYNRKTYAMNLSTQVPVCFEDVEVQYHLESGEDTWWKGTVVEFAQHWDGSSEILGKAQVVFEGRGEYAREISDLFFLKGMRVRHCERADPADTSPWRYAGAVVDEDEGMYGGTGKVGREK